MKYQNFIVDVLTKAKTIALNNFGKVKGVAKKGDHNQVLTETDLIVGKMLINSIKKEFPYQSIIDEEAGVIDNHSEFTWIIDPIDGTSNFANAIPMYGIMIGLLKYGQPIAGGIALPSFDELYVAALNEGTFLNGKKIRLDNNQTLASSLVAYGIDGHQENPSFTIKECASLAQIILRIRNLRSSNSCFDIGLVVKGSYGAWINKSQRIWDNVAEHIVAEEAGAIVTDFYGKKLDYSNPLKRVKEEFTICIAPSHIHKELMEITSSAP